jgi:uncharacterized membrane protein
MADPSLFDAVRLPSEVLIALDNRTLHFAMQPWHYLIRMAHILSTAAFFGGILLFDLRLIGIRSYAKLRAFSGDAFPLIHTSFAIAMVTGVLLLLYDPLHMGSRAYFMPKIILIVLALINAAVCHRFFFKEALAKEPGTPTPTSSKIAGTLSIAFWIGVMVFSSMNAEGVPKVLLQ